MTSRRANEGWVMFDHRDSPGVSDNELIWFNPDMPPGSGKGLFEAPVITCSHCQRQMIVNPKRDRVRPYCRSCDHDMCDDCAMAFKVSGVHRSFKQVMDDVVNRAAKGLSIPIFERPSHG